ncbi:MAG: hypothetical protein J6T36_02670, partial [Campylobacter sp.]|nr:hypothetical protein [Campylobacter sp.]
PVGVAGLLRICYANSRNDNGNKFEVYKIIQSKFQGNIFASQKTLRLFWSCYADDFTPNLQKIRLFSCIVANLA